MEEIPWTCGFQSQIRDPSTTEQVPSFTGGTFRFDSIRDNDDWNLFSHSLTYDRGQCRTGGRNHIGVSCHDIKHFTWRDRIFIGVVRHENVIAQIQNDRDPKFMGALREDEILHRTALHKDHSACTAQLPDTK